MAFCYVPQILKCSKTTFVVREGHEPMKYSYGKSQICRHEPIEKCCWRIECQL